MKAADLARFLDKVDRSVDGGCWMWTASTRGRRGDYGQFRIGGRTLVAHRVAYEHFIGPIPEGLTLDHRCGERLCVRPDHMDPATNSENVARGNRARRLRRLVTAS